MAEIKRSEVWQEHEREQLRAWRELTYQQRLNWLWQAKLFAQRALQSAADRRAHKKPIRSGDS
jgi:hypothetical protein